MSSRSTSAFTWIEALVGLAICAVLGMFAMNALARYGGCGRTSGFVLSSLKQLHSASQAMVHDGEVRTNVALGWPGDVRGTYKGWAESLVPAYLSTNDFCKLISAPGKIVNPGKFPSFMRESGVLVYGVTKQSPGETVFLSTANFTNSPNGGLRLDSKAKPFGNAYFIVIRKAGDGGFLWPRDIGKPNAVGFYAPLLE